MPAVSEKFELFNKFKDIHSYQVGHDAWLAVVVDYDFNRVVSIFHGKFKIIITF